MDAGGATPLELQAPQITAGQRQRELHSHHPTPLLSRTQLWFIPQMPQMRWQTERESDCGA
jgi:hypothetical protein